MASTEEQLSESKEQLRLIIDNLAEGLIVVKPDGESLHWNRMAIELHGYAQQDERMGRLQEIVKDYKLLTPEGHALPFDVWPIPKLLREGSLKDFDAILCNLHLGWQRDVRYGGMLVRDTAGHVQMGLLTITDMTERRRAERARADAERRLRLAVDIAHLGFWEWTIVDDSVYISPQWKQLLGYEDGEILGDIREWTRRLHPDDSESARDEIRQFLAYPNGVMQTEYRMLHKDGSYRSMLSRAIADVDEDGKPIRLIGTMLDVTEQKLVEQRVREAAQHDPLTGLPNRALIFEYASHLVAAADRKHGRGAMLFIDLDRFKPVNDLYGHEIGDALLKEVAQRMQACVRHEDLIGRIGGDEFVIVLPYLGKGYAGATVAQHVINALSRPFDINGIELLISASIGISFYPMHGSDVDLLLHRADLAMYRAKEIGSGNYQIFTQELCNRVDRSGSIETRIKEGLSENRFELHYQPIIDIVSGQLVAAEALLRLPAGQGEAIGPDRFIPVAESAGIMCQLGDWVLGEICRQQQDWIRLGMAPLIISMNISALQFQQRGFAHRLLDIVHDAHADPHFLQIEVTEAAVMERIDDAIDVLNELHAAGVHIALDDFGVGYSSLSVLSHMPLDVLKVDQSFIHRLGHDRGSQAVTDAIIAMGLTLKMDVVAEGIESEQSLAYLRSRGCAQAQGNYFSEPMPAGDFLHWYRHYLPETQTGTSHSASPQLH